MPHSNIEVYEYLQPHYKWNLVSIAFCDRMLIILISKGCSDKEVSDLEKYLNKNLFHRYEDTNIYYRLKSRSGEFVEPKTFDIENGDVRVEMIKRFIGRTQQF